MMIAAIAAALVSCQSKGNQNNNTMDEARNDCCRQRFFRSSRL